MAERSEKNRHGLARDIPDPVMRTVRRDCGFACVMCGSIGMHYDHFNPEFVDCQEHKPDGIALLCPTCHQDKTSGRLANDNVARARARARERWQNPAWRSQWYGQSVLLRVGNNVLQGPSVGLSLGSTPLLLIEAGVDDLEPWLLTGTLAHGAGEIARFERNKVIACSGNWDVELSGQLLVFRRKLGEIVLELSLGEREIGINRLNLQWPSGVRLSVDRSGDVTIENLRHASKRNELKRIIFKDNKFVMAAQKPEAMPRLISISGGGVHIDHMELSGNEVTGFAGIADLGTFVNVADFLSEDMLHV